MGLNGYTDSSRLHDACPVEVDRLLQRLVEMMHRGSQIAAAELEAELAYLPARLAELHAQEEQLLGEWARQHHATPPLGFAAAPETAVRAPVDAPPRPA